MLSIKQQQYCKFFIKNIDNIKLVQLVRLLYIAHGYSLVMHDYPFFKEGEIECTCFGAIPIEIYEHFIAFDEHDLHGNLIVTKKHADGYLKLILSSKELEVLNLVLEIYAKIDGWISNVLANDCHSPWYKIVEKKGFYHTIPNAMTKRYFKNIVSIMTDKKKEKKMQINRSSNVILH